MFSKYDVYTTVQSIYCYPDTYTILKQENVDMTIATLERIHRLLLSSKAESEREMETLRKNIEKMKNTGEKWSDKSGEYGNLEYSEAYLEVHQRLTDTINESVEIAKNFRQISNEKMPKIGDNAMTENSGESPKAHCLGSGLFCIFRRVICG